jgi:hypothetical protein
MLLLNKQSSLKRMITITKSSSSSSNNLVTDKEISSMKDPGKETQTEINMEIAAATYSQILARGLEEIMIVHQTTTIIRIKELITINSELVDFPP